MILPSVSWAGLLPGLAAIVAYALPAFWRQAPSALWSRCLWIACIAHALSLLGALAGIGDQASRFGFAPALSTTAWLVLTGYLLERVRFPQLRELRPMALLGALSVLATLIFPGSALPQTASAWLPLHLALGVAAYGLLAAAVVHAALMAHAERQMRSGRGHGGIPLLALERLTFRFVLAGFVLLTATLAAGLLFSEQIYGRAWRWDHKVVFSLLAWGTLAILLLGRWRFGWRGRMASRILYMGTGLLLLAYVGSRFVLEVVLGRLP